MSFKLTGVDELKQIVQPRAQPAPLVMCKEPLATNSVQIGVASYREDCRESPQETTTQGRSGCSPARELESIGAASLLQGRVASTNF